MEGGYMDNNRTLSIVDNIFIKVFNQINKFTLDEIREKFAYEINLPRKVKDNITMEETYTNFLKGSHFVIDKNMRKNNICMMRKKERINSFDDIMEIWNQINFITTERVVDSTNVSKSDKIFGSNDVYMCTSCSNSNNIIYCDCVNNCEYVLASKGTDNCNYCICSCDSSSSSNSFGITWSNKIVNSMFILDCNNLYECMFCAHIGHKRFCIANMQFEEKEYYEIKEKIIEYILSNKI